MLKKIRQIFNKHPYRNTAIFLFLLWFYFLLPKSLFNNSYSTILLDKNNQLLGAKIALDGQWRFPKSDSVPYKFRQAIIHFEDAYFYKHLGVNPISLSKALYQDIKAGKIVRGGSTLTMQVARMSRGKHSRNIYQKLIEIFLALRIEISYSKKEILSLYASHAPFGGNVVGLEAASWRYFSRSPFELSWAESATLAVLPNAPGLIFPGKNHNKLKEKRNRLLKKLLTEKVIDSITYELSIAELLPDKPKALPQFAPHLLQRAINEGKQGQRIISTLDRNIQKSINQIATNHIQYLTANKIYNMGIVIAEVETGNVLAYMGNTSYQNNKKSGFVDMVMANRSTGSLIKPWLHALALKDGLILPKTLLKDVPTQISGYHPSNFSKTYEGAVPADISLAKSLNIPAIRLLRSYGVEKFYENINKLHLTSFNKSANHYGLTIILGGAEIKLWEAVGVYAGMARVLNNYSKGGKYNLYDYDLPHYVATKKKKPLFVNDDIFGAGNIWFTFKAISDKDRPVEGGDWNIYQSAQKIAWKTGTSFGFRDAWCVGITPKYVVGVWVGNATGEGRPGLTGTRIAAPIVFDVFKKLPKSKWFAKPLNDITKAKVCKQSGMHASQNCKDIVWQEIPINNKQDEVCQYHQLIHLNKEKTKRVNSSCYNVADMLTEKYFVLPPVMAWYYKRKNPSYKTLPPWEDNCRPDSEKNMDLIYPKYHAKIFIPKDFNKVQQKVIFKAAHRNPDIEIFWHLNNKYIGSTKGNHQIEIYTTKGKYVLTLIDENGEMLSRKFEIVN